jgi:Flp pilus assembly protein TadG
MMGRLGAAIRRLVHDREGVAAIEFAILAPLLLALLMGTVTIFDLFRMSQTVEKATFTAGDILSRQSTINAAYLQSTFQTLTALVGGDATQMSMRVTSIKRTLSTYSVDWSKVNGRAVPLLTTPTIPTDRIPDIADGDSIIVIDTFVPHRSIFSIAGFDAVTFNSMSVYRPRFTSSIAFVN